MLSPSLSVTFSRFEQPENALTPIDLTFEGISISIRPVQLAKVLFPIVVTVSGIMTSVRLVQFANK